MVNGIVDLIYSFLLSMVLFLLFKIEWKIYLLFFIAIWLMVFLRYGRTENRLVMRRFMCIAFGNLFSYVLLKVLEVGTNPHIDSVEKILMCAAAGCILVAAIIAFSKPKVQKELPENQLFKTRSHDYDRLKRQIEAHRLLGLNSCWGNGKTFLMEKLQEDSDVKCNFEIIRVELLTCNLDRIEWMLLNELDKLLKKHGILSPYSGQLRRMMEKNTYLSMLQEWFFTQETSSAEAFQKMKDALSLLDKKILIVYEDIDRITDIQKLKTIFGISEKLSGENIHVLYQYDAYNLERIGLDRAYLEKYIPFVVNLTEMEYEELVRELWNEIMPENIAIDQSDIRLIPNCLFGNFVLKKELQLNSEMKIQMEGISVRKVAVFLEELKDEWLQKKDIYCKENWKTLEKVIYIRHFFYDFFKDFRFFKSPLETIVFHFSETEYTMTQIVSMVRRENNQEKKNKLLSDIHEMLKQQDNKNAYGILALLGYRFEREKCKPEEIWEIQEHNEKIDRIVWNYLGNGKSEYTNLEAVADIFIKNVLSMPLEQQKECWRIFQNDMFEGNLQKDNHTIFKFGVSSLETVFQSFFIKKESQEHWCQLVDFYFNLKKPSVITKELIEVLNYCNVNSGKLYITILQNFCTCKIAGNLNEEECYKIFFEKYFGAIFSLGYSQSHVCEWWKYELSGPVGENIAYIDSLLQDTKEQLEKEKEQLAMIPKAVEEFSLIQRFVELNRELISVPEKVPVEHSRGMSMESRVIMQNEKEYHRLEELRPDKEKFLEEIRRSYENDRINMLELQRLVKEVK